jgi:hypothetical protein
VVLAPGGPWVLGHANFWKAVGGKFWQSPAILDQKLWHHLWSTNHISCLQTLKYPSYGSDELCCIVVLAPGGPWVPGNANFWKTAGENFGSHQQFWTKSHGICGQQTISAASRPLNILYMVVMSDAA